jgi:uncharacterized protein YceK
MMKGFKTLAFLLMAMVSLSGCAAVVVGGAAAGATYTYVSGWMHREYGVNLGKAYHAALQAVKNHDLEISDQGKDVTTAFIKAKGAKREIWINLKRLSRHTTKVSIRVGVLGDKEAARIIHRSIEELL